jgi:chemotaxis protein methyltransferase CheR
MDKTTRLSGRAPGAEAGMSAAIRGDPVLSLLYQKVEEVFGVRVTADQLSRLKAYLDARRTLRPGAFGEALGDPEEIAGIVPLITVNETYFFRESVHFRLFSRQLLPLLAGRGGPIRVCSAATSSGCEAYSIAMLVDFYCRGRDLRTGAERRVSWEVDAFDLNPAMIEAAKRGRYTANALREDGAEWKFLTELYLRPDPPYFETAEILRDKVRFFTHNLMEALPGIYDVIFFRNALIYFSPENRRKVLGHLIRALSPGGSLFVGVSETSSVEEEGLELAHHQGVFYFTRRLVPGPAIPEPPGIRVPGPPVPPPSEPQAPAPPEAPPGPRALPRPAPDPQFAAGIARILGREEGRPNAGRVLDFLRNAGGPESPAGARPPAPDAGELTAAALTLLNDADFPSAALVLRRLEEQGPSPVTSFLWGEFYYHRGGEAAAAEAKYQEAAAGEQGFWPAHYRIGSLAEEGNPVRRVYRLRKALESMEKGAGRGYEVFIGGFSPDYYRRILENRLALQGPGD